MFEQLVDSGVNRRSGRRWICFCFTAAIWLATASGTLVVGVLAYDARLNSSYDQLTLIAPPLPYSPAPSAGPPARGSNSKQPGFTAVQKAPVGIKLTQTSVPPTFNFDVGPVGPGDAGPGVGGPGSPYGVIGAPNDSVNTDPPPKPVEVRAEPKKPDTVAAPVRRISGGVIQGTAIRRPEPAYPAIARQLRLGGSVLVEVVIDERGDVVTARAMSGHALLRDAAEKAARQWKWNPTRLGGTPVQVIGSITFNFKFE